MSIFASITSLSTSTRSRKGKRRNLGSNTSLSEPSRLPRIWVRRCQWQCIMNNPRMPCPESPPPPPPPPPPCCPACATPWTPPVWSIPEIILQNIYILESRVCALQFTIHRVHQSPTDYLVHLLHRIDTDLTSLHLTRAIPPYMHLFPTSLSLSLLRVSCPQPHLHLSPVPFRQMLPFLVTRSLSTSNPRLCCAVVPSVHLIHRFLLRIFASHTTNTVWVAPEPLLCAQPPEPLL
jgi:hypothetical protein